MKERGLLLVISGPAGSGKSTVAEQLVQAHGDEYALSVSCTTRKPRGSEQDGVNYFFIDRARFAEMIGKDFFLEYAEYCNGDLYGTPKQFVEQQLDRGMNVVLEIDVQGGLMVKERWKDAVLIMVTPPDAKTLERRLRGRKTNSEEDIMNRLQTGREELKKFPLYDYAVVNEDGGSSEAAEEIYGIIRAEKHSTRRNASFARNFYAET